ncbi:MAG: hypothetical protein HQK99_08580 [Nitrospirae bacterium]|nr:hypothetical protein [Nitrospirota bacterium]
MSIIKTVETNEAAGTVAKVYAALKQSLGFVPNGMKLLSSSPQTLDRQFQSVSYYMNHPTLGQALIAMVRMLVSMKTFCAYCVDINTRLLLDMGFSAEAIQATKKNPEMAPLGEKEKAMLLFVMKSVFDGHAVEKGDIAQLRKLGWTDADILDATALGAYMMAGDILYNAFKVEKEAA